MLVRRVAIAIVLVTPLSGIIASGNPVSASTVGAPTITAVRFSNIGPNLRSRLTARASGLLRSACRTSVSPRTSVFRIRHEVAVGGTVAMLTACSTHLGQTVRSWSTGLPLGRTARDISQVGDQVSVSVSNRLGGQAAVWKGTLRASPGPQPTPAEPNPVITSVNFANIGPDMRMVVSGDGFGSAAAGLPYVGQPSNFSFSDTSRGGCSGVLWQC